VAGTHKTPQGDVMLKQEFQMLSGFLRTNDGKSLALKGKVNGEEVTFTAGGREYRGRFSGGKLDLKS
jgi:hypothetical protein